MCSGEGSLVPEVQLGHGLSWLVFVQVQVLHLWGLCLCVRMPGRLYTGITVG